MTAQPRFRPVLVHDVDREVGMTRCPTEDVLILYATVLPDDEPESEELLEGWTVTALSSHLGTCEACRRQVAELGELTGALRDDGLGAPPAAFWDEMAADVMSSIDGSAERAPGEAADNVIPLHRDETMEPVPASVPVVAWRGSLAWWRWAVAATLIVGVSVAFVLATGPRDGDGADGGGAVADGEGLVPTADEAAALAAELGIDLSPAQPEELFAAGVLDVGDAIDEAGWSSLQRDLERMDGVGEWELALVGDDPLEELIELDAEELALLLDALESKT